MNGGDRSSPPRGVPTLTEVVPWPDALAPSRESAPEAVAEPASMPAPMLVPSLVTSPAPPPPAGSLPSEQQLVQDVMTGLQRQIDLMLDYRLRETLAPLLARAADSLVRDARHELASTLREVVERAVAQELARHRTR